MLYGIRIHSPSVASKETQHGFGEYYVCNVVNQSVSWGSTVDLGVSKISWLNFTICHDLKTTIRRTLVASSDNLFLDKEGCGSD